jgi:hypothetical protein
VIDHQLQLGSQHWRARTAPNHLARQARATTNHLVSFSHHPISNPSWLLHILWLLLLWVQCDYLCKCWSKLLSCLRDGIQQQNKLLLQDGVLGTNGLIPPWWNWTCNFQVQFLAWCQGAQGAWQVQWLPYVGWHWLCDYYCWARGDSLSHFRHIGCIATFESLFICCQGHKGHGNSNNAMSFLELLNRRNYLMLW